MSQQHVVKWQNGIVGMKIRLTWSLCGRSPQSPHPPLFFIFLLTTFLFTKYFTQEKKLLQLAWRKARCVIQAAVFNSFEAHNLFFKKNIACIISLS